MLWIILATACLDGTAPLIEARGGGAGYWPPHSETAVRGSIEWQFDGFEVDITPTADGEWLLQGGLRWVDCIDERTGLPPTPPEVASWTMVEARSNLRCGSTPDEERPNALLIAERPVSLGALTSIVRAGGFGAQRVHLHVRSGSEDSAPVRNLVQLWQMADLPNPLVVSTDDLLSLQAVARESRVANLELDTILRLGGEVDTELAISLDDTTWRGLEDARATGIAVPVGSLSMQVSRGARRRGLSVMATNANEPARWPAGVESVLTDFPGDLAPEPWR